MKQCMRCKHCYRECYEDSIEACELFGEEIPEWSNNENDGCLLKEQEINKALKISEQIRFVGTSTKLDEYSFPIFTDEDKEHNKRVNKEYKDYIETLKQRCIKRRVSNNGKRI